MNQLLSLQFQEILQLQAFIYLHIRISSITLVFPLVFNLKPQLLHGGEPPPLEPFSSSHFQLFSKFPLTLPSPSLPLPKCELTGAGACRRFKPSLGSKPPPTQKPPGLPRRRSCLRSHVPALVSPTCLVSPPSKPHLPSKPSF